VLSPKHMKELSVKVNAAAIIKKDYVRLRNTDLVKENQQLWEIASEALKENEQLKKRNSALQKEKTKLFWENDLLKGEISDLKREIGLVYKSTKEFLKERTEDVRAFRNVFKSLVDKIKVKISQAREKQNLRPQASEFEKVYKRELSEERNRGFER
ncbi:putative nuclease with TOPRIM domain, partial [Bacillus thermophilus]|nr:putative nuclease with TOPRIM domain [Siminovitchia thermophila]